MLCMLICDFWCMCLYNTPCCALDQRQSTRGYGRWVTPPNHESLPFRRAKMAVQCIFAGQLNGPRTIWSKVTEYLHGANLLTLRKYILMLSPCFGHKHTGACSLCQNDYHQEVSRVLWHIWVCCKPLAFASFYDISLMWSSAFAMLKILSTRAVGSSLLTVATCPIALFGTCF